MSGMKAVQLTRKGPPDVLQLVDVKKPQPTRGEVLVKVKAAGINPVDTQIRSGSFMGFLVKVPQVLGGDVAGLVAENGPRASKFAVGAEVIALTTGFQPWAAAGCYAEYAVVPETVLASKPQNLGWAEAGGVPLVALTAFQALESAGVKGGERVLIHGGSGGVGTFAVQLAKVRGAHVITTTGPKNLQFMKELGADEVFDYRSQDLAAELAGRPVDVVIDAIGGPAERASFRVLKRRGHYQRILSKTFSVLSAQYSAFWGLLGLGPTYGVTFVTPNAKQLQHISDLISQGRVRVVLDRTYPLGQAAKAHAYLEEGHARGKVVLTVG